MIVDRGPGFIAGVTVPYRLCDLLRVDPQWWHRAPRALPWRAFSSCLPPTLFSANFFHSIPSKQDRSTFKVEVNNSGDRLVSSRELSTIAESDLPASANEWIKSMKGGSPSE